MSVEVLVAAIHQKDHSLLEKMNIQSDVIVGNQCDRNEIESFEIKAHVGGGAPITVYRGKTIGHKAICQFPAIKTWKIEIILDRSKNVTANMKFFKMF